MPFDWGTAKKVGAMKPQELPTEFSEGKETIPAGNAVSAQEGLVVSPRTKLSFGDESVSEDMFSEEVGYVGPEEKSSRNGSQELSDSTADVNQESDGWDLTAEEAIRMASRMTDMPEDIAFGFAQIESSMRPGIKADTSSATGLFQFTDDTWKSVIEKYGAKYDMTLENSDRTNPLDNSLMMAELLEENVDMLNKAKMPVTPTNLYIMHFLGAGSGKKLIRMAKAVPYAPAAGVFKAQAKANPNIFYKNGNVKKPRSFKEINDFLDSKVQKSMKVTEKYQRTSSVEPEMMTPRTEDLGTIEAVEPTIRDRIFSGVNNFFDSLGFESSKNIARNAQDMADFLPIIGDSIALDEGSKAMTDGIKEGDGLKATLGAIESLGGVVGLVPGVGDAASLAIFAGVKKVKNLDTKMFSKAQELDAQGLGADEIYNRTKFFKDTQGEWRYDISDRHAKLNFDINTLQKAPPDFALKLESLLDHKLLFDKYPELRDIEVRLFNGPSESRGYYAKGGGFMGVNTNRSSDSDLMHTILHESQHAVQDIEDLVGGGSMKKYYDNDLKIKSNQVEKKYNSIKEDVANELSFFKQSLPKEKVDEIIQEFVSTEVSPGSPYYNMFFDGSKVSLEDSVMYKGYVDSFIQDYGRDVYQRLHTIEGVEDLIKMFPEKTMKSQDDYLAYLMYKRIPGEVESRTVEKRFKEDLRDLPTTAMDIENESLDKQLDYFKKVIKMTEDSYGIKSSLKPENL